MWTDLRTPIMCLAPMEGVTDMAFRTLLSEIGKPDLMFTEFVSVDGLCSRGRDAALHYIEYQKNERPLIAQIWGLVPEHYEKVAAELVERGFDGVDINMGCPVDAVVKKGACSALIKNKPLASEIIAAVKKGTDGKIPVSVKCRIGYEKIETEDWIRFLLEHGIDALTIHGRTTAEQSRVPCHWDEIGKAVAIRNAMNSRTKIIGNGDVLDLQEAREKVETYDLDGVMIGRGIFQNPWLFADRKVEDVSVDERIQTLLRHMELFETFWGDRKHFDIMKRFFKVYVRDFTSAQDLRTKLMDCTDFESAREEIYGDIYHLDLD